MTRVFVGSEALLAGEVTRHQLSARCQRVFPGVYAARGPLTLLDRTEAAWLWSRRRGVVTGRAAAALHGAKWVDDDSDIELNVPNNKSPRGVITRNETLLPGETLTVQGLPGVPVTTVHRTAFDLARRLSMRRAVAHLDALCAATAFTATDVQRIAEQHPHVKGLRSIDQVLFAMDSGAQSPRETYLRLDLIDAGFPRPQTQIPVRRPNGRYYYLDMGWEDVMLAVEYDGEHHRTSRRTYVVDMERLEYLQSIGWIVVRVLADHRRVDVIERVRRAWALQAAA